MTDLLDGKRWPTILTQIVSTLSNEIHGLTTSDAPGDKIEEGKQIIRKISELKHDMGRNKVLAQVFFFLDTFLHMSVILTLSKRVLQSHPE